MGLVGIIALMSEKNILSFSILFVFIVVSILIDQWNRHKKSPKTYQPDPEKKLKRNLKKEAGGERGEEVVLDLEFNNNSPYYMNYILSFLGSILFAFFISIIILLIGKGMVDPVYLKNHQNEMDTFEAILFFSLCTFFVLRNLRWTRKVIKMKEKFKRTDVLFSSSGMKINLFLFIDNKINPKHSQELFSLDPNPPNDKYVEVLWEDLESLIVFDEFYERRESFVYRYRLKTKNGNLILNRSFFGMQEPEFFDLILDHTDIGIIYRTISVKPFDPKKSERIGGIVGILFVLFLLLMKYLNMFSHKRL